jgi:hypothetical protein
MVVNGYRIKCFTTTALSPENSSIKFRNEFREKSDGGPTGGSIPLLWYFHPDRGGFLGADN